MGEKTTDKMRLSIIIPVYNAETTVGTTLRGILEQLSPEVEVIVVDDGSTDSTPEILAEMTSNVDAPVQVIRQENAGAAAARNAAIDHASGDYLAFADADDRFSEGAIDIILKELEGGADILGWDWQTVYEGNVRHFRQAAYSTQKDALRNLMGGTMKWNLWLFTVKRKMVVDNGIRFVPGADMGEDMAFMLRAFACAGSVRQIHKELYIYNAPGVASVSRQLDGKRRSQVTENLTAAESFLMDSSYGDLCKANLPFLKLYIKRPLLIGKSLDNYHLWYEWFPESNAFACKNRELPFHTRVLQWAASKGLWGLVRLYNWLFEVFTGK